MNRTTLLSLAAAAASLLPAAAASAATASDAETPLTVTGAYLYLDHVAGDGSTSVRLVFSTDEPLDRRYDGAIRAGAAIAGVNHSIGSLKRGTRCYTGATQVRRDGRIPTVSGEGAEVVYKKVKAGQKLKVRIFTRGGQEETRTLTVRKERADSDRGMKLPC